MELNKSANINPTNSGKKKKKDYPGIFVKDYNEKTDTNELIKYFSEYGDITSFHKGHNFIIINFIDDSIVKKILESKSHTFRGDKLFVRQKLPRIELNDSEAAAELHERIKSEMEQVNTFEEEAHCLLANLQPQTAEFYHKPRIVCEEIYNILSKNYPYVMIFPFGSTVAELNFITSDLDIFINQAGTEKTEIDCLNQIKSVLMASKRFGQCVLISHARIPIIKCVHLRTRMRCDLSIKTMLGVQNTQLIKYYMNLNTKVQRAMCILKYWANQHKLTGQKCLFSNYAITMMFIFFLQQKPYYFPNVLSLQNPNQTKNFDSLWNAEFKPTIFYSETLTKISIFDLIKQFFDFYLNFQYDVHIASVFLGKCLPRNYFDKPEELPDYFQNYKNFKRNENAPIQIASDSPVYVQDPFEHARNITGNVNKTMLAKFLLHLELAKKICSEDNQILYNLLTQYVQEYQDTISCTTDSDLLKISIQNDKPQRFKILIEFFRIVLTDFLLIDILSESDNNDVCATKKMKIDETTKSIRDDPDTIRFICSAKLSTWANRKCLAKTIGVTGKPIIERETTIAKYYKEIKEQYKDGGINELLQFNVTLENKEKEIVILVEKLTCYKKTFKDFSNFLLKNIPAWFQAYEQEKH